MCGIAGFTQFSHQFGGEHSLRQMGDVIIHRGPDAGEIYLDDEIGLCHRRLSIIDLSALGNQPMVSTNGQYIISFNGEIYNYQHLREELVNKGYHFQSNTDTEVLLALYEFYGKGLLEKINGMFAFAIWDKINKKLFIARDRIGKKPLYYYKLENDIVFSSELKSILTLEDIPREIRPDAVYDFFAYQYVPDPKTIFKNIFKLEPGHYLEITENSFEKNQYWDVSFANQSTENKETLKDRLLQLINKYTQIRMISDVPLGAFLSGGIDSSGIVATMANHSSTPITTCSIGFDEKKYNETEFAKIVSDQYQTLHHEFTVHQNVKDNLKEIVSYFDEPFADPSLVPTFFVSELARQKVTVAIAGDGGDEVFAGYEKYVTDHMENRLRSLFPGLIRKKVFPYLARFFSKRNNPIARKGFSLLTSLSLEPAMGFYISNSQITDDTWNSLVNDDIKQALGNYHPSKITTDFYNACDAKDHLSKILYADLKTYLPGCILVKVDRMSMANSLEVRAPILDHHIIEFAATLPPHLKFHNGEKKYLLKEAFKDILPDEILYRKKMGFSVPLAEWFRDEIKCLAERTLFNAKGGIKDYFNMDEVRRMWDTHQSGKRDHSMNLWCMLMFQMWWDKYMKEYQSLKA